MYHINRDSTFSFADLTEDEMLGRKGRLRSSGYNGGHPFSYTQSELNSAPVSLGKKHEETTSW